MKFHLIFLCISGALKAICDGSRISDEPMICELALAGIKNVVQNSEITVDLHSAVYMFHLAQALIKLVTVKDAYNNHVGTIES